MNFDKVRFLRICFENTTKSRDRYNIGTYKESTLHSILKQYCCDDRAYHEISVDGFIADVKIENNITEIQTSGFYTMKKKLEVFLQNYNVRIVYPIPQIKWVAWIDPDTGEVANKNRSPKKPSAIKILSEMSGITDYLLNEKLTFSVFMLEVIDYRLLDGWSKDKKKGATKYDRIPIALIDVIDIDSPNDLIKLLPDDLPSEFTAKQFSKCMRLSSRDAYSAIKTLETVGIVKNIGMSGRAKLYEYSRKKV